MAIAAKKAPCNHAHALGFKEQFGDVVRVEQLGGVVRQKFDVIELVRAGDLLLHTVEERLLHQRGQIHLDLQGAIFLVGTNGMPERGLQYTAGLGVGRIFEENITKRFHGVSFCGRVRSPHCVLNKYQFFIR